MSAWGENAPDLDAFVTDMSVKASNAMIDALSRVVDTVPASEQDRLQRSVMTGAMAIALRTTATVVGRRTVPVPAEGVLGFAFLSLMAGHQMFGLRRATAAEQATAYATLVEIVNRFREPGT